MLHHSAHAKSRLTTFCPSVWRRFDSPAVWTGAARRHSTGGDAAAADHGQTAWPSSSTFASYGLSLPPNPAQLNFSNRFFETAAPVFLSSAAKFRTLPLSSVPEVAFLGRSNVGKSSLLNALLHRTRAQIAHVSSKPGRTRSMNAFGVGGVKAVGREHQKWEGRGGLVIMDMPGYGRASQEDWGREIVKYLKDRKQLRRTFVLIDSEHGVKETDMQLLRLLWSNFIPYQVVMSKIDKVLVPTTKTGSPESMAYHLEKLPDIFELARSNTQQQGASNGPPLADVITCSSQVDIPPGSGRKIGVENLRWAVLCAAGLDCDETGSKRIVETTYAGD